MNSVRQVILLDYEIDGRPISLLILTIMKKLSNITIIKP